MIGSMSDGRLTQADLYSVIGEDGFARVVKAFYAQVPQDDILGPMRARVGSLLLAAVIFNNFVRRKAASR